MRHWLLAALLMACWEGSRAAADGPRAAVSEEQAHSLDRKFQELLAQKRAGRLPRDKTVLVTEGELNSYVNLMTKMPPSLSNLEIRLERDRIGATGLLDLDQLQGKLPSGGVFSAFAFLSGKMQVVLKGRLQNQEGFGSIDFEEIRVGSIPISEAVLAKMVAAATKSEERPEGFDVLAPFRYPYSVRKIRLQAGRAYLDF
jgi:hypothetical protein